MRSCCPARPRLRLSRVIGNIEAEVRHLSAFVVDVRQASAEQHRENREKLESIGERVEKIEVDMKPLAKTRGDHGADCRRLCRDTLEYRRRLCSRRNSATQGTSTFAARLLPVDVFNGGYYAAGKARSTSRPPRS